MDERLSHPLVPRFASREYDAETLSERCRWVEQATGANLSMVSAGTIPAESMRGNIENPIGTVQMPVGVAGPLLVRGEHADGVFYVPLATTEGALVRSYERGMVLLTKVGGAEVRIERDENQICPVFQFESVASASAFSPFLAENFEELRRRAESTTNHGKLLAVDPLVVGRDVEVVFRYHTGDAHGMNMIVKATDAA